MNAQPHASAYDSPGSHEPGLRRFWDQAANRTPTAFAARLLSAAELDRIKGLLFGPQWPVALDRRLVNLGLAMIVLGKTVATTTAITALWREEYEVRRGNDVRRLAVVAVIESDTARDALATAWDMARRDVGPRWRGRLVQEGDDGRWIIFLPPPRPWTARAIRPYVLELQRIHL